MKGPQPPVFSGMERATLQTVFVVRFEIREDCINTV